MFQGTKVIFKKLKASASPDVPTPEYGRYIPGQDNGNVSLPVDYTVKGSLIADVVVGEPVQISRTERNGVKIDGITVTSPVSKISGNKIETKNSIYMMLPTS